MKKITLALLMAIGVVFLAFGQSNTFHNHFHPSNVLINQQVEFIDSGQSGENRLWDFSRAKIINDEYVLIYNLPPLLNNSIYTMGGMHFLKKEMNEND